MQGAGPGALRSLCNTDGIGARNSGQGERARFAPQAPELGQVVHKQKKFQEHSIKVSGAGHDDSKNLQAPSRHGETCKGHPDPTFRPACRLSFVQQKCYGRDLKIPECKYISRAGHGRSRAHRQLAAARAKAVSHFLFGEHYIAQDAHIHWSKVMAKPISSRAFPTHRKVRQFESVLASSIQGPVIKIAQRWPASIVNWQRAPTCPHPPARHAPRTLPLTRPREPCFPNLWPTPPYALPLFAPGTC